MEIKLNLLSESKKKAIHRTRRFRFVLFQEILLLGLLFLYAAALYGMKYSLSVREQEEVRIDQSEKENTVFREIDETENLFDEVNTKVKEMDTLRQSHIVWTNALKTLNETVSDGIVLSALSSTDRTLSIVGTAREREGLLAFQDRLRNNPCIQDVRVPLSDLFSREKVEFQMDADVKEECLKNGSL